jgi:hypothetical protein
MVNAKTKPQLTPTFNGLNKFKYFLALGFLVTLSFNTFSADNSQQPNKKELNKEEFNKEAYLDLSKPLKPNKNARYLNAKLIRTSKRPL